MTPEERAEHTHAKDDPQQWPDEGKKGVTTVKISVRLFLACVVNTAAVYGLVWLAAVVRGWESIAFLSVVTTWSTLLLLYAVTLRRQWRDDRRP